MARSTIFLALLFGLFAGNAFSQSQTVSVPEAQALCDRIAEIKELTDKVESGADAVYDEIVNAGEAVIPCLIEKVTDTTIMRDPRCPTISTATKVGDIAYFVLAIITKMSFTEFLPPDVREKYKTKGVYAYHDYIEQNGKRKELQSKLREWYAKRQNR